MGESRNKILKHLDNARRVYLTLKKTIEANEARKADILLNNYKKATTKDIENLQAYIRSETTSLSDTLKNIHQSLHFKTQIDIMNNFHQAKREMEIDEKFETVAEEFKRLQSSLATELESLQESLKDVKTQQQLNEVYRKQELRTKIINQSFEALGKLASATGNGELAPKFAACAAAFASMDTIFCGLNGFGALAGVHPVILGTLLCLTVASLIGGITDQDDSSEAVFEMLSLLSKKLDAILQFFPILLEVMSQQHGEMLQQFSHVHDDATVIKQKLDIIKNQLHRADSERKLDTQALVKEIKDLKIQESLIPIKSVIDKIIRTIDTAKQFEARDKHSLARLAEMINELYVTITGTSECRSSTLTGQVFSKETIETNPSIISTLLKPMRAPLSPLGTIAHFQKQLKFEKLYQPEHVDKILDELASEEKSILIHKTHFLSHLKKPTAELFAFFCGETAKTTLVIPTLVRGTYGLLLADKTQNNVKYFGTKESNDYVVKFIEKIKQVEEKDKFKIEFYNLEEAHPAIFIVYLVKQLISNKDLSKLTPPANFNEYDKLEQECRTYYAEDFAIETPLSAPISAVAIHEYVTLTQKLFNPDPNTVAYRQTTDNDIQQLVNILKLIELTRLQIQGITLPFILYLVKNYGAANRNLRVKLNEHLEDYQAKSITPQINAQATETSKANYQKALKQLNAQEFQVMTQSKCSLIAKRGKISVNWFQLVVDAYKEYEQIGHANDWWGTTYHYEDKRAQYLREQQFVISDAKRKFIESHPSCDSYRNEVKLFDPSIIVTKELPLVMEFGNEVMPAIDWDADSIPDHFFELQAHQAGRIIQRGKIVEDKLVVELLFVMNNSDKYFLISEKSIYFKENFPGSESVWRRLMNHKGPIDPDTIQLNYIETGPTSGFKCEAFYCVTPTMTNHVGLKACDMKEVKHENTAKELDELKQSIEDKKAELRKAWSHQLQHEIQMGNSPIGKAVAEVEAWWQLLLHTLNFLSCEQNSNLELIKKILATNCQTEFFIGDQDNLIRFLNQYYSHNLIDFLPQEEDIKNLEQEISILFRHREKTKEEHLLDEAERSLLNAIERLTPLVKASQSKENEVDPEKLIKEAMRSIALWQASGCKPGEAEKILQAFYRRGCEQFPALAASNPLLQHSMYTSQQKGASASGITYQLKK